MGKEQAASRTQPRAGGVGARGRRPVVRSGGRHVVRMGSSAARHRRAHPQPPPPGISSGHVASRGRHHRPAPVSAEYPSDDGTGPRVISRRHRAARWALAFRPGCPPSDRWFPTACPVLAPLQAAGVLLAPVRVDHELGQGRSWWFAG
ncbi:hypothetical protein C2845_PM04G20710 [Panicum miliaceum]|uniref:Uncharacterized protein n=1 Tax=Panicum miliaceum TaxID=4540 RepID=A0A3L6QWV0_PANMI|nr:hypothetical protein C2845_PM04G20710 [Panicum miliaceum]